MPLPARAVSKAAPGKLPVLAGDWNTGHGVFYIEQDGPRVFGTYDYKGTRDNQFEGKLEKAPGGLVLRFAWKQPSLPEAERSGSAVVQVTGNGTRWAGEWFDSNGNKVQNFKGTKIGASPQEPERERAPIRASAVPLEDFTHPAFVSERASGKPVRLSEFVQGKRLVLVSFVTAWCKNCNWEQPFIRKLYDRYHSRGLDVLLVSHYAHPHDIGKFVERHRPPYPMVVASTTTDDATRTGTLHYRFRTANGDVRKWGTPFNILIKDGDLSRPFLAAGEFIEADALKFMRQNLTAETQRAQKKR